MTTDLFEADRDYGDETDHVVEAVANGIGRAASLAIPVHTSLAAMEVARSAQTHALSELVKRYDGSHSIDHVTVHTGPWAGLGLHYLAFRITFKDGMTLYGGIDTNGDVST